METLLDNVDRFVRFVRYEPLRTTSARRSVSNRRSARFDDHHIARIPIREFGPLALMAVRQKFVERRWSRKTINARVERIRIPLYAAAARGLRPGGVLVLEAYAPDQIGRGTGGPRDPDMLAALAELIAELDGLEFLHSRELERDVREGAYHSAVASVVQVIGVRQHRGSEASS